MTRFRRTCIALTVVCALAPTAHAQINLAWNDCRGLPNAATNVDYACDGSRNGTPFRLVFSFIAPDDLDAFVGVQTTVSIWTMYASEGPHLAPLTDWWRLGAGDCRDGNIVFPASMSGVGTGSTGACRNPFLGAATGGGYQYTYGTYNPDDVRLVTAFARDTPIALEKGQHYVAGVLTLDTFGDVATDGVELCAGCCDKRAILVYQMELYQAPNQVPPQQDIYFLTGTGSEYVMWQGHENCATPAHHSSWGRIKATYR